MKKFVPFISLLIMALSLGFFVEAFAQEGAAPVEASAAPQVASEAVPVEQEAQAEPVSDEAAPPAEDGQVLWGRGSLMLDKKTSEWISTAIKSHEKQIPLEILLPNLFPPEGKEVIEEKPIETQQPTPDMAPKVEAVKEAPVFYLKSILYFGKDNWAVWLNNKKITNQSSDENIDKTEDISIVKASKYEIIFLWKKTNIDKIYPKWKTEFVSIDGQKYTSIEKNIVVDVVSGNISFVLKPNQSLVTNPLVIVEGRATTAKSEAQTPAAAGGTPGIVPPGTTVPAQPVPDLSGSSNKNVDNTLETSKNLEILKSVLDGNIEKLGNHNE